MNYRIRPNNLGYFQLYQHSEKIGPIFKTFAEVLSFGKECEKCDYFNLQQYDMENS